MSVSFHGIAFSAWYQAGMGEALGAAARNAEMSRPMSHVLNPTRLAGAKMQIMLCVSEPTIGTPRIRSLLLQQVASGNEIQGTR